MDVFHIVTKHFWALAIFVNLVNVTVLKKGIKEHIAQAPELALGYNDLMKKYAIWLNLPWAFMGAGILIGRANSVFDFMAVRDADPFVLGWWGVLFFELVIVNWWILYRKGAERLLKYNRAHTLNLTDPKHIKLFFIFCSAGVVAAFVMLVMMGENVVPSF